MLVVRLKFGLIHVHYTLGLDLLAYCIYFISTSILDLLRSPLIQNKSVKHPETQFDNNIIQ